VGNGARTSQSVDADIGLISQVSGELSASTRARFRRRLLVDPGRPGSARRPGAAEWLGELSRRRPHTCRRSPWSSGAGRLVSV